MLEPSRIGLAGTIIDASPHLLVVATAAGEELRLPMSVATSIWHGGPTGPDALRQGREVIMRVTPGGSMVERVWVEIARVTGVIVDRWKCTAVVDAGPHRGRHRLIFSEQSWERVQVRHPRFEPGQLADVIGVRSADGTRVAARTPAAAPARPEYMGARVTARPRTDPLPASFAGTVTWFGDAFSADPFGAYPEDPAHRDAGAADRSGLAAAGAGRSPIGGSDANLAAPGGASGAGRTGGAGAAVTGGGVGARAAGPNAGLAGPNAGAGPSAGEAAGLGDDACEVDLRGGVAEGGAPWAASARGAARGETWDAGRGAARGAASGAARGAEWGAARGAEVGPALGLGWGAARGAAYPALDPSGDGASCAQVARPGCAGLPYLSLGSRLRIRNECDDRSATLPVIGCGCAAAWFCDRCVECGASARGRIAELTPLSFVDLGGDLASGCFNATLGVA